MSAPEKVVIGNAELWCGDCREVFPLLTPVDSVLTDPPYGLGFMGKDWDHHVPGAHFWEAINAKPGAHMLAFGGTRTFHRLACAIEDAGWGLRDTLMWVYGTGFPKSLDVSKAIDKAAGAERPIVGFSKQQQQRTPAVGTTTYGDYKGQSGDITAAATDAARQWVGYGTALKPAWEPIILARKPLIGTVADNVLAHGTGALNVDGCRVSGEPWKAHRATGLASVKFFSNGDTPVIDKVPHEFGRWPANLIHDGSDEVVGLFPESGSGSGVVKKAKPGAQPFNTERGWNSHNMTRDGASAPEDYGDSGSAARFFYCAKASKAERGADNKHPTVKPLALMEYLLRLINHPKGRTLDPFMGSGSTGVACARLGHAFVGVELDRKHFDTACARIDAAQKQRVQRESAAWV